MADPNLHKLYLEESEK